MAERERERERESNIREARVRKYISVNFRRGVAFVASFGNISLSHKYYVTLVFRGVSKTQTLKQRPKTQNCLKQRPKTPDPKLSKTKSKTPDPKFAISHRPRKFEFN